MRIVSVWLPRWPILRFLAAEARNPSCAPVDPGRPFVLAVDVPGGPRIAALNEAAAAEGLAVKDLLADARARSDGLQVRAADPAAADAALARLALWATRYTPNIAPWGEENGADGFFLDITGAAHLFGGEEALIADLRQRLDRFGFPARLAIADTPGTAWALSRFHESPHVILPSGEEAEALAPLPVEALRLSLDTCTTLRRLGFKRVGAFMDQPRAPFAARFEKELLNRLDQALGRASEPLAFIVPPPAYHNVRHLQEPVVASQAVVALAGQLMEALVPALERDGMGARTLRIALYRIDGEAIVIPLGLTMPTRSVAHMTRLLDLKLERLTGTIDVGLGFEALVLSVTACEPMDARQGDLVTAAEGRAGEVETAALVDRLRQRLGPRSVGRLRPVASHLPERAETVSAATDAGAVWLSPEEEASPRPPILLLRAEPVDVTALVPEGPPQRFRWRGVLHEVAHAQGPERIADEWWRDRGSGLTRDYYLVEDGNGRRFWFYRDGLYGRETAAPRWFVQGLFA